MFACACMFVRVYMLFADEHIHVRTFKLNMCKSTHACMVGKNPVAIYNYNNIDQFWEPCRLRMQYALKCNTNMLLNAKCMYAIRLHVNMYCNICRASVRVYLYDEFFCHPERCVLFSLFKFNSTHQLYFYFWFKLTDRDNA